MAAEAAQALVGIGYRGAIADWTRAHLHRFDVLEITVDHCLHGGTAQRGEIFALADAIPLTAHGIGLSIGTDVPLDLAYLDAVAAIVERLKAPAYSEHLAFTRVPGRDLANLLPLPRTEAVAAAIIAKIRTVQSRVPVPFLLENIAYLFDWPDGDMSDAAFLNLICRESAAGLLLDIENLYLNARNHRFDAYGFLDALPAGIVKEIHMAGGIAVRDPRLEWPVLADSHSHPLPDETLLLLDHALARQQPYAIIVERDDRLDAGTEILDDVGRVRAVLEARRGKAPAETAKPAPGPLLARQSQLLDYLTSPAAIFGEGGALPPSLQGIEPGLLHLEARFSHEKRIEKVAGVFPLTLQLLAEEREAILRAFAASAPPVSIGRRETAQQFFAFLTERWRAQPPVIPYLDDVARCELALATARASRDEASEIDGLGDGAIIRRAPGAVLLRCAYDIRGIFEDGAARAPRRRSTPLVIALPRDASEPVIVEVPPALFDLVAALDDWTAQEAFGATAEAQALIGDLATRGILDVRP